jgi:hypothetical protein
MKMSERTGYRRNPAIHCWIKHIEEGNYDENENLFQTIFGEVKRIRFVATIIEKNEKLIESDDFEAGLDDDSKVNVRLLFSLDDSTGLIRAIKDDVDPERYADFNVGDTVDVVGRVSKRGGYVSLWIEIIRKIEDPNFILLRNAEVIKRIKSGDVHKVPVLSNVNDSREDEFNYGDGNDLKEKVYSIIKSHSERGKGIIFGNLKKEIKLPDIELRSYINDLILESKIYESDKDIFESY